MSFFNNKPLVLTVIILIVLVVCLFVTAANSEAGAIQSVIGRVIAPVQEALYGVTDSIADWFDAMFVSTDIEAENLTLKERVAQLESELLEYAETKSENDRLKGLLNVVDSYNSQELVTARVIGRSPGAWYDEFTVNAGSDNGIQANMPVITQDGLVGRIVEVGATYSKVMTIVNSTSGVSALVERTRENCVLQGNSPELGDVAENVMSLKYLDSGADVEAGDSILTSGNDAMFPKGLFLGTVSEVSRQSTTDKTVYVTSPVNFATIEEVIIVKEVVS